MIEGFRTLSNIDPLIESLAVDYPMNVNEEGMWSMVGRCSVRDGSHDRQCTRPIHDSGPHIRHVTRDDYQGRPIGSAWFTWFGEE